MSGKKKYLRYGAYLLLLQLLIMLAACGGDDSPVQDGAPETGATEAEQVISTPVPSPTTAPSPTPLPTATPQPAALVNGQPIAVAEYERELARYEKAQAELGNDLSQLEFDYHALVLDALIERELLRQAAAVLGITVAPEELDLKMDELRTVGGENGGFDSWLAANLYSEEEFRAALAIELMVEKMVAVITADVPAAVEHVHVRYIQVDNADSAQSILAQLDEGADFGDLAQRYSLDRLTAPFGGDLGFFARGSLLVPEIEDVAFDLQPEEISDIITVTDPDSGIATYYIVQMIERDPDRMLTADLRHRLLQEAFDNWLAEQLQNAAVIKFQGQ